jgi:glycosyltransferase involved in cell wall biosynthesis
MDEVGLSVIVPCLNCEDVIATQLTALEGQRCDRPWEILIADNGSTDRTLGIVQDYQTRMPHLRIVDASARRGAGPARNIAALEARGHALAFCDADDAVRPGWVQAMVTALDQHDVVAGALDLQALNPAWRLPKYHHFGIPGSPHTDVFRYRHAPHLRHASASNLAVRRSLHLEVGGFDETIRFNQDMDYCLRLQTLGYSLTFVPEAIVDYRLRHTLGATCRQGYRWGNYSVLIYRNHLGDANLTQHLRFLFGGWRYLPQILAGVRTRADWFELAGWWGGRWGEVQGCLTYLILPRLLGTRHAGRSHPELATPVSPKHPPSPSTSSSTSSSNSSAARRS